MLIGHRTWLFTNKPVIASTGVVGGPFEARGNIPNDFDILHDDTWLKQDSFEKAQQILMEEACQVAVKKLSMDKEQWLCFINKNLVHQVTSTNFGAKTI